MNVIDTSVVIKWFALEEQSDLASELVGSALIAPDVILAELGNALWKKWRRGEIAPLQAYRALAEAPNAIGLVTTPSLAPTALEISIEFNHPVYDCFFLALAERSALPLITADKRLIGKIAGSRFGSLVKTLDDLQ